MARAIHVLAILFALMPASSAHAEDCGNQTTQLAMNECATRNLEAADGALNAVYGELMSKLDGDQQKRLKQAQRAWIIFRDAHCELIGSATEGGSIHRMVISKCLMEITRDRTEQLSKQVNCEEGDVSCAGKPGN
jgi:uncharacterized protein YecT (DUF1311 family)